MAARSILVDGSPSGRIGHVVKRIEPLDDGRAWILAATIRGSYAPTWGVYEWSLADGEVTVVAEGSSEPVGLAARGGRVFIGGHSWEVRWHDLPGGASGAVPGVNGRMFAGCSPDGRYIATERRGEQRTSWWRIWAVVADGRTFPELPAPPVFSDDSRFAACIAGAGGTLRWIALADGATGTIDLGAAEGGWLGVCPVRGAPRVIAWSRGRLAVCDLPARSVVERHAVESLQWVNDAAARRCVIAGGDEDVEVLELGGVSRVRLPNKVLPRATLTPDGRRALCHHGSVLDVVDTSSGAVFSAHEGHRTAVRGLVWSRDDALVASCDDDGRVRVHRAIDPPGLAELAGARSLAPVVAFGRDGRRLYSVTASAIEVADAATGAITARFASFGTYIHSAEITADGRHLVIGSYGHGIRVVDVESGQHVTSEADASRYTSKLVLVGDGIVALRCERLVGPAPLPEPCEFVHWLRLDLAGKILARGTWPINGGHGGVEMRADRLAVMVTAGNRLWTFDPRDPDGPGCGVQLPIGATLVDVRDGRALLHEQDDLVRRDPATGAEVWRIRCPRRAWRASLSHRGDAVAVAYRDAGVEVLEYVSEAGVR